MLENVGLVIAEEHNTTYMIDERVSTVNSTTMTDERVPAFHSATMTTPTMTASKQRFPCNTCGLVFDESLPQRRHMREPWHVYNLKRRTNDQPPVSADEYAEFMATTLVVGGGSKRKSQGVGSSRSTTGLSKETRIAEKVSDDEVVEVDQHHQEEEEEKEEEDDDDEEETSSILNCLFCTHRLDSMEDNVEHMYSEHGLYIPDLECLSSLEVFLGYLRTIITTYNECLYCGAAKQSTEGARRHMLDKGHCMINLEREPELLEFWEFSDNDDSDEDEDELADSSARKAESSTVSMGLSGGERVLPSGKTVVAREGRFSKEPHRSRTHRTNQTAKSSSTPTVVKELNPSTDDNTSFNTTESAHETSISAERPMPRKDTGVAARDMVGLVGVSDQRLRSLVTLHRKTQRQQAIVRASAAWADELGGRSQKHFKVKMNLRAG